MTSNDLSQLEEHKKNTCYLGHETEWSQILRHAIYHDAQVKFDLWQLCESRSSEHSQLNRLALAIARPKTVSIQSKLNQNRNKVEKMCNTCDHKIEVADSAAAFVAVNSVDRKSISES